VAEQIPTGLPALPCPECRERGRGGGARIGNHRLTCGTCNRWAQKVMRAARSRLIELHADEYARMRLEIERDLYPGVLEAYSQAHPVKT
jgi:hypothetical protein